MSRVRATTVLVLVAVLGVVQPGVAGERDPVGPDVVTYDVYEPYYYGNVGGIAAYAVGTESCNRGDEPVNWYSTDPEHPVIAQNLYRLKHGRLEQIGMSWLKHGFASLNENECDTCTYPPAGGSQLGVGCSDPYWASLNGSQDRLGPRHEVNAFTGEFPYPHSSPEGDSTLKGRLLAEVVDLDPLLNPSARYFAEGQYVTADEAVAGNGENSASYREQTIDINLEMTDVGSTFESQPAIYAWQAADPTVSITEVRVPDEGLFIVAARVDDNGDGTWRYDYGIRNVNSHRAARSFTVPVGQGVEITNTGFHDVDYHSGEPYDGTDWIIVVDDINRTLTWTAGPFFPYSDTNALRWGTMYNFWFDADQEPIQGPATIGLFLSGTPDTVTVDVPVPSAAALIFSDGFESGTTSAWTSVGP